MVLPKTGYITSQHSTAQHSTAQHSTAQHSTAQLCAHLVSIMRGVSVPALFSSIPLPITFLYPRFHLSTGPAFAFLSTVGDIDVKTLHSAIFLLRNVVLFMICLCCLSKKSSIWGLSRTAKQASSSGAAMNFMAWSHPALPCPPQPRPSPPRR